MNLLIHPLFLVTFFPLAGVIVLLFIKSDKKTLPRWVALVTSLISFAFSVAMLAQFNASNPDLQMVIDIPWINIAGYEISFQMGIDGLSVLLVMLTTFLTPISILSTWSAVEERVK